ncbi:helix-turn-helix domain-containing protein [Chungangia koreensis]|uniref:Helix-turn-helix domain-containing protein n=1 Tax=Chungangia koreensis TaxID=752657 RepID=A0ABV8X6R1_9LACT
MTNFDRLLLTLISSFQGERTVSAVFHLLNGKRSGQTLQDVEYYNMKSYFSILPKLKKELFDKYIENLVNKDLIKIEHSIAHLTQKGIECAKEPVEFMFNGWIYRGKEWEFFYRLSLIVQTLSQAITKDMKFVPVQKDEKIQQFVKVYLSSKPYIEYRFISDFKCEMIESISSGLLNDEQKNMIVHRLTGKGVSGWTWRQMAERTDCAEMDVYLAFIEALHKWLDQLTFEPSKFPLLREIAYDIKARTPLTESATKTSHLFSQGFSMEQITEIRKLKMSTIEDHFVEMAINEMAFPISRFLTNSELEQVQKAVKELNSKKLRLLKERLPNLSYFQLRLGMAYKEGEKSAQTKAPSRS